MPIFAADAAPNGIYVAAADDYDVSGCMFVVTVHERRVVLIVFMFGRNSIIAFVSVIL